MKVEIENRKVRFEYIFPPHSLTPYYVFGHEAIVLGRAFE